MQDELHCDCIRKWKLNDNKECSKGVKKKQSFKLQIKNYWTNESPRSTIPCHGSVTNYLHSPYCTYRTNTPSHTFSITLIGDRSAVCMRFERPVWCARSGQDETQFSCAMFYINRVLSPRLPRNAGPGAHHAIPHSSRPSIGARGLTAWAAWSLADQPAPKPHDSDRIINNTIDKSAPRAFPNTFKTHQLHFPQPGSSCACAIAAESRGILLLFFVCICVF